MESDSSQHYESASQSDVFSDSGSQIGSFLLHRTPELGIQVEMVQFLLKLLLKPGLWSRYSNFRLRASKCFGCGSNIQLLLITSRT